MGMQIKGVKLTRHDDGKEVISMSEGEIKKLREDYANLANKVISLEERIEVLENK